MMQQMLAAVMLYIGWLAQVQSVPAPESKRWVAIVIAIVLMIAVAAVSTINPKRGHRD